MVFVVGAKDGVDAVHRLVEPQRVLLESSVALAVQVNVPPGVSVGKGQFIGSKSDDAAVFVVELLAQLDSFASAKSKDIGNTGCSPPEGTGETCQRVEIEVVDQISAAVQNQLQSQSEHATGACFRRRLRTSVIAAAKDRIMVFLEDNRPSTAG